MRQRLVPSLNVLGLRGLRDAIRRRGRRTLLSALTAAVIFTMTSCSMLPAVIPSNGGPYSQLQAVACSSSSNCFAMGSGGSTALAESWNGGRWLEMPIPNPGGTNRNSLNSPDAITCLTGGICVTAGSGATASQNVRGTVGSLFERWNGSNWSVMPSGKSPPLAAVSCVSPSMCIAVGGNLGPSPETGVAFALHWNGHNWSSMRVSSPKGSGFNALACVNARSCIVVGSISLNRTLVEQWNGSRWSIVTAPSPLGGELDSIACISSSNCWAVGADSRGALIERWNGSVWSMEVVPDPPRASLAGLGGVACQAGSCMAVGSYSPNGGLGSDTLAEEWDGHRWRIVRTVNEPNSGLNSVACPSTRTCIAVGGYAPSMESNEHALVEQWNGALWSIVAKSVVRDQL